MVATRFPRSVYGAGKEPDARFSLANERTFLAWVRTAVALIAAGVALEALALPLQPSLRLAASVVLIVLGLAVTIASYAGWARAEKAMRRGTELPASIALIVLVAGVAVAGVLVLLAVVLR
ncbi:YidH family protein [Rarobacter incanus]|uniref:Putative membrane protein n=1 Tax=Rarobacter incanus TaxID=153494 RepID=A0A542SQ75_9MICO|nr:DUF202 domain-containing protein [Rarobacter incanus]TQK76763.1 putative membrane protein [Rarobacter incanus]